MNLFPFQKSSAGSTGATFLPVDYNFRWVVKWQNRALTESEHLSTTFYRKAFQHLSVPTTLYPAPEELMTKVVKIFQSQKNVNIADTHVPMFMQYRDGSTLNKLIEKDHILKLPDNELKKLFRMLGEIAAYDYLIANFDRFLPSDFDGTINHKHSANGGNILVELEDIRPIAKTAEFKTVQVIDNAPLPTGFFTLEEQKEPANEEDQAFNLEGLGLFDETEPQEIETISSNPASAVDGQKLRDGHHEKFVRFRDSEEKDLKILAKQIRIGIINQWNDVLAQKGIQKHPFLEDPKLPSLMEESIFEGLKNAREKMVSINIHETISNLEKMEITTTAGKIVLDFIRKNLMCIENKINV